MRFQSVFVCLFAVVSLSAQQNVPSYISSETPIAKAGILANIGSNGAKSQGAKPGIVIASPSATNPNYLFTWTRDSSLVVPSYIPHMLNADLTLSKVFKALIDQYVSGQDNSLLGLINDFVTSQAIIQGISNPSGSITTGGLGMIFWGPAISRPTKRIHGQENPSLTLAKPHLQIPGADPKEVHWISLLPLSPFLTHV